MMKNFSFPGIGHFLALPLLVAVLTEPALAQDSSVAGRILMLKNTLTASKAALRQYEWVQTTVTTIDGTEASRKQERCFYGDDGSLTKEILNPSASAPQPPDSSKRRSAERKARDLMLYIDQAVGLVRAYFPLDEDRIVLAKNTGQITIQPEVPGQRARLIFGNYISAGDSYALDVNLTNNCPITANVKSFAETKNDPVALALTFGTLEDGTLFPANAVLDAPKKKLKLTVQNSGYRKRAHSPTPGKTSN